MPFKSLCAFPIFGFSFTVPELLPDIPIPIFDLSFNLNTYCPLDL